METIKLEYSKIYNEVPTMTRGLDVEVLDWADNWAQFYGPVFDLACLVERHETGDWGIQLDETSCGHDHVQAAQYIDQYVI